MDYVILAAFLLVAALLCNRWGVFSLIAALISYLFSNSELFYVITALCYTPFALHKSNFVKISGLCIVIAYYLFGIEYAIGGEYFLPDTAYVFFVSVLNFSLIASLLKSGDNDVGSTIAALARVYNYKSHQTR